MNAPEYYRVRLAKGAAWVPLKIWFGHPTDPVTLEVLTERPAMWRAVRDGKDEAIEDCVLEIMHGIPWVAGERITEVDYLFYLKGNEHDRMYDPAAPGANPRKAIDMNQLKPIRW